MFDEDEPVLTPAFEERWYETAAGIAGDSDRRRAAAAECADEGGTLTVGGGWTGDWPSRAALAADLASERPLADRGVAELDRLDRANLVARIRGLATRCPVCASATDVTVDSCCGSSAVVAVTCAGCDARLAEFDPSPATFAPGS